MFARISARKRSIGFSIAILMLMVGGRFLLVSRRTAAAPAPNTTNAPTTLVTTSSLGQFSPTFAGPAATGCTGYGCSLLHRPFFVPSTAPLFSKGSGAAKPLTESGIQSIPKALPSHSRPRPPHGFGPNITITPPSVSCQPLGPGCDIISSFSGGAIGVKGLNAVDSATQPTNVSVGDIEPPDQGLCAGNGFVVESNNIGEILVFDTKLQRKSAVIPLDTIMGLTSRGWSSGGDISCLYDHDKRRALVLYADCLFNPGVRWGPFCGLLCRRGQYLL